MVRMFALFGAAAALAMVAAPAIAQQRPAAAAPVARSFATPRAPSVLPHAVSPYGSNQPFPPPRFWSELISKQFTRQAMDASYHTRDVDLANKASVMIDHGDCAGAEDFLQTMGAPEMAARVPATCAAKQRGLI